MMKKNSLSFLGYAFWGVLFLAWILFLFFDAKKETFLWADNAQLSPANEASQLSGEDPHQNAELLSGFLQQEEVLTSENLQSLGELKEKIEVLEQLFAEQAKSELANLLLEAYQLDKQFDTAKKFYLSLNEEMKADLDQTLDFKLGIQTFSQTSDTEYRNLKALLEQKYEQKLFSSLERKYYAIAFALADQRYDAVKAGIQELYGTKYQDFARGIQSAFDQYANLKDVPAYYQDALLAYQLMNEGFLALSKKMALSLVNQYPNYILPYQILANVDFSMGKRSSAARYFSQLLELDYQEKNLYLYHLGACYYRLEKYSDAVLYLAQITDPSILLDSDRYLILSYLALGEEERVFSGWQRLLGYRSIKKSDFYSFFEEALRKSYRLWKSSPYLKKNEKLVQSYLLACSKKLSWSDAEVCQYGELGLAAQQGKISDLEVQVSRLARKYPKSEFFLLLAQLAEEKWDEKEATASLMRALSLTKSAEEKAYLKEQILKLNEVE